MAEDTIDEALKLNSALRPSSKSTTSNTVGLAVAEEPGGESGALSISAMAVATSATPPPFRCLDPHPLSPLPSAAQMLCGGDGYHHTMPYRLMQEYGLPSDVALHLAQRYGDRAFDVIEIDRKAGTSQSVPVRCVAHYLCALHVVSLL